MKSQARMRKRMEARRQELLRQIETQKRIWEAALAGDDRACEFLSKQYLGVNVEQEADNKVPPFLHRR